MNIRQVELADLPVVAEMMHYALEPYYGGDHRAHARRIVETAASGSIDSKGHFSAAQIMFVAEDEDAQVVGVMNFVVKHHFAYTEALDTDFKRIHRQTHDIAQLPHMNDIIGPITNPINPQLMSRRVVGINHLIDPEIVAQAYCILNEKGVTNMKHAFFVRGFADAERLRGMDEVSICNGGTRVTELRDGEVMTYHLNAEDFGLKPCQEKEIVPVGNKGQFSLGILRGEIDGPPRDMVLANAAMLFYLGGKAQSFKEGFDLSREVLQSGAPHEKMLAVRAHCT